MKKSIIIILVALFSGTTMFAQNIPEMLEDVIGSVVTIGVYKNDLAKNALGFRGEAATEIAYQKALDLSGVTSSGSGFIIEKNGRKYVITNAHVVENASDDPESLYVFTINRNKYEVKLVGGDSFYDLAVLEFIDQPGDEISTIKFTISDPRLGERVFAIGNPLGEYPYTITDGIISAKNRVRGSMTGKFGFLQTTATIIWGNSGGPLINEKGEVVGVNSQIAFADLPDGSQILQQQINFALEADISEKIVDDILKTDGRVVRAYLGIELVQNYEYYNVGYDEYVYWEVDEKPRLTAVLRGSPAFRALGDMIDYFITAINGNEINNLEEALGELEDVKPGQRVTFTLEDGYNKTTATVTTSELTPKKLEVLAGYVMDKNEDITMDYDHPQVSFTMGNNEMYYQQQENKGYRQNHRSGYDPEKYFILAAGVHSDDASGMWIVEDYQNLGAALRLSGLAGSIDYYVLIAGGSEDDVEVVRQYLSGDEEVIQSTLWY